MRTPWRIRICVLVFFAFAPGWLSGEVVAQTNHNWESVEYPELPRGNTDKFQRSIMLVNSTNTLTHENTLQLDIILYAGHYTRNGSLRAPEPPADANKATVRLHCPDGSRFDGKPLDENGSGLQLSGSVSYDYMYTLPWLTNSMDEAWIELHLGSEVYWVEIPYGFTRNPASPLPAAGNLRGKPKFVPAMEKMKEKDKILQWSSVHYDVGKIQNGWRLDLYISNPVDARAEVVLYRGDMKLGKGMLLWELHAPRTTFVIECPNGRICSTEMSIRLHEDGMRRSDSFHVCRDSDEERGWGTAIITVDDKAYSCLIPSSLFQYEHGLADTRDKAVVPIDDSPK